MAEKFVTLITGAAQGIGAAIAKTLAANGHNLVINYYSHEEEAHQTAQECIDLGADVIVMQADVSQPDDCKSLVAATIERFGYMDLLVNNAGISSFSKSMGFENQSYEMFDKIFQTNVRSVFILAQESAPHMIKRGKGSIINISSNAGLSGRTDSSLIYAASKGAMNTLTLGLARALTPHIRVNAVCPSIVDTTWWAKRFPDDTQRAEFIHKMAGHNPLGKVITPEEVANTVLFLFQTESFNGELIRIDSGSHC